MDPSDSDPGAGRVVVAKSTNPLKDTKNMRRKKRIEEKERHQYLEDKLISEDILKGKNPWAHKFSRLGSFPVNNGYHHVECAKGSLTGCIMSKRASSSMLFFYDLRCGGDFGVRVLASLSNSGLDKDEFLKLHKNAKCGDIVDVTGYPGKTEMRDFYFFARSFIILPHCFYTMADNVNVKRPEILVKGETSNSEARVLKFQIFKTRAKIISFVRRFLDSKNFLEVETPVLNRIPGGTAARPFVTYYNDLDMKLYMRIAPELSLKQLIVGGLDRVYEIGKQFRNEGIDLTHNPEFTTCEFYMAFADYYDLMQMTEEMLSGMVKELTGGYKIKYHPNGYDKNPIEIDFTPPFRRIEVIEELEREADLKIPKDLSSDEANKYLIDACARLDVKCPPPQTTASLLYKLVGKFLEVKCVNPTFIIDHPEIMSPLGKWHRSKKGLTERFELFINQHEVLNGCTELNDPVVQRQRFADQLKHRQSGNDEAMAFDETFCTALEDGMPPTAGWRMGIERVTMLLSDSKNIKEVILFPVMRPSQKESAAAEGNRLQGSLLTRTQPVDSMTLILKLLEGDSIAWTEEDNGLMMMIRIDKIDPEKLSFAKK